jgi:hypothetical protein
LRHSADADECAGDGIGLAGAAASPSDLPALLFVEAAPHTGVLTCVERPLETFGAYGAGEAYRDRSRSLLNRRTRRSHREEEVGVLSRAAAEIYPVHPLGHKESERIV